LDRCPLAAGCTCAWRMRAARACSPGCRGVPPCGLRSWDASNARRKSK
jgi:hypothetical protein